MEKRIIEKFGNRLRIRVCGILEKEGKVLMVRHRSIGEKQYLWAPPGGGMKFGTSAESNLIREFREETGLDISVMEFLFVHEFLSPPLHAVELFFNVNQIGGSLKLGTDPEMNDGKQLINELKFMSIEEIKSMNPLVIHHALKGINTLQDLSKMGRYAKFEHFQ